MLISYEEAIVRALSNVARLGVERVMLSEADGRVLAEDVIAADPMPPFSGSAMDGYAVRVADFTGAGPWELVVLGEARAGGRAPATRAGCATRIFTGAPIPDGADAVIIQENVVRLASERDRILIRERPQEGQNIRREGGDLARGGVALEAGERIGPGALGLLAALDRVLVQVARRPVVAIVSTGDELRSPGMSRPDAHVTPDTTISADVTLSDDAPFAPEASIAESNSFVVAALARRVGAITRTTPLVKDDAQRLDQELRRAIEGSDMLVTIGGASVGDHDLVRAGLDALGARFDFWGVAIKPGKPTGVGRVGTCRIVALPGNPASAAICFSLFGVPLLRALQGDRRPRPRRVTMRIIGTHVRKSGREEYLRARLELHDGELCAVLGRGQSSGAVTSFAHADALVVLGANESRISHGDRLPVIMLGELWG